MFLFPLSPSLQLVGISYISCVILKYKDYEIKDEIGGVCGTHRGEEIQCSGEET